MHTAPSLILPERVPGGRAKMRVEHKRAYDRDEKTGLFLYRDVDPAEEVWNLIMNVGRIFLHKQGYGTTSLGTNGLNYIALSNTAATANPADTTLSGEIVANGLSRTQGTVVLPTGAGNQTTIANTFTATGAQSAQTAALFDLASAGNINHVLGFTGRSLITGDQLVVTYTITLG